MQVNLHGTPCILGVFFTVLVIQKSTISTNESTKIRHFDSKISKIFWGGGTAPPQTPPPVERGTPSPHTLTLTLGIERGRGGHKKSGEK